MCINNTDCISIKHIIGMLTILSVFSNLIYNIQQSKFYFALSINIEKKYVNGDYTSIIYPTGSKYHEMKQIRETIYLPLILCAYVQSSLNLL